MIPVPRTSYYYIIISTSVTCHAHPGADWYATMDTMMIPAAATIGVVIGPAKYAQSSTAVVMIAVDSARFFTIASQYFKTNPMRMPPSAPARARRASGALARVLARISCARSRRHLDAISAASRRAEASDEECE